MLAIFAVLIAAIAWGVISRRGDGDPKAAPVGPIGAPATTQASTPGVADRPPALINTGEDWDAIVRSMVAYSDWLYLHPKPELLDAFALPSTPSYADTKLGLTNLATKGWRYDPPRAPTTVEIVRLNSRINATSTAVFVRFGASPQYRVVDQSGAEVANTPATTVGQSFIWTLVQKDGRWYLSDVDAL
ncbi:MAG: hypothetical protein ACRDZW_07330 [Acidimicrobiales bacterium]